MLSLGTQLLSPEEAKQPPGRATCERPDPGPSEVPTSVDHQPGEPEDLQTIPASTLTGPG